MPPVSIRYLDSREAAEVLGMQAQTCRAMRAAGRSPEPDAMAGRQPGGRPETIERWKAHRER